MAEAIALLAFDSFVDDEARSMARSELVGGRSFAMAAGSERHDLAAGLVYEALAAGARLAGCRPFTSTRILRTPSDAAYYPDVMVVCGQARHRHYEDRASVIVEVLSPSTVMIDRREKALAYANMVDLEALVLLDPEQRRVEVAMLLGGHIAGWEVFGPGQVISTRFGDLDLDEIYDALDASATT